jgi:peptide/nickel transport system substrate-binding protein
MIYDTLVRVGPDSKPMPWAAEKWTKVDPTTVDVTLRDGMTFHDGKPVTVEDVAFTFRFFMKWKPAYYASSLNPLKSVKVVDGRTVRFKTQRPYAPLVMLTFTQIPLLPKHVWEGVVEREKIPNPGRWANPKHIGSGPYRLVRHRPAQEIRLTRFDQHFSPPKTRDWLFILYASQEAEFLALLNKKLDFFDRGLSSVQYDEAKRVKFLDVKEVPDIGVFWLQFNLRPNSPFHDYAFRRAFAHLIDSKTIINVVLRGLGEPGRGVIAPANKFWHNASIPSAEVEGKPHYHQYNPEKARAILKAAGYEWGDDGRLYFPADYKPKTYPGSGS